MTFARSILFASFTLAAAAHAAPGEVDLRFGIGGIVAIDSGDQFDGIQALLPEDDNAVLAGGRLNAVTLPRGSFQGEEMTIVRMLGNGELDANFGIGGFAQVGFGGDEEYVSDMVKDDQGRIVAVGVLERQAYSDHGVARFYPDGFLDESFGEVPEVDRGIRRRGAIAYNIGPTLAINDRAVGVAIQRDGRIVVAGIAYATQGNFVYPRFGLSRLTTDGELDPSFAGIGGTNVVPSVETEWSEYVTAIARHRDDSLEEDDGFVVVGYSSSPARGLMRRFHADGTPDLAFGTSGTVVLQSANAGGGVRTGVSRIDDAVLQDDGKIVIVGTADDNGFTFLRFFANGQPDTSFGTNGRTTVKFSASTDYDAPAALTLQADGKIVAAGSATSRATGSGDLNFASVRLLPNGRPDPGYGDGAGRATHALSTEQDRALAVTVTSDGSLLFAGQADFDPAISNRDATFLRLQGDPTIFADGFED